ncbi:MAG: hypothetical protein FJ197_08175 [Gammaproteobacteria bacterium]|nr:hypothetical protein [Gammaproteobacteria bacterium]
MKPICIVALVLTLASACGGPPANESGSSTEPDTDHTALRDAVQEPLDRASAVGDITAGRKGELDEAMEDDGGS